MKFKVLFDIYFINGSKEEDPLSIAKFRWDGLFLCWQQAFDVQLVLGRETLKKLTLRKYDPLVNQHVLFHEVKMPSGKKRT